MEKTLKSAFHRVAKVKLSYRNRIKLSERPQKTVCLICFNSSRLP
ncbi:hypothetical protein POKO110462_16345 [Pontibacter korlensis]